MVLLEINKKNIKMLLQQHDSEGGNKINDSLGKLFLTMSDESDAGDIVRGSGGVRKVRWALSGKGKSGGIRVIYYWKVAADEIWLLTAYAKNERPTIPGHILKAIAQEIEDE